MRTPLLVSRSEAVSELNQALREQRVLAGPDPEDGVCSRRGQNLRRIIAERFGRAYSLSGIYYLLHEQLDLRDLMPPSPTHENRSGSPGRF